MMYFLSPRKGIDVQSIHSFGDLVEPNQEVRCPSRSTYATNSRNGDEREPIITGSSIKVAAPAVVR